MTSGDDDIGKDKIYPDVPSKPLSANQVEDIDAAKSRKKAMLGESYKYDPDFKGPVIKRSCTDCLCLIIYVILALASLCVAVFAFYRGNPSLLMYPTDSQGNVCGYNQYSDKPNLVYYDLIQCVKSLPSLVVAGCATTQQCVKNCPSTTWTWVTLYGEEKVYGINIEKRKSQMLCLDHIDFNQAPWSTYNLKDLVFDGYCAPYLIEEKPIIYRCMPSFLVDTAYAMTNKTLYDSMNNTISEVSMRASKEVHKAVLEVQHWGQKALADVQACWIHMLVFCSIALVFAFLWIVLLRFFAKAIIWTTIIVFIILWLAGTAFCFWRYNLLTNYVDITPPEEMRVFTDAISFQTEFDNPDLWLAVGIICGVILLVTLIVLCFLGARIRLAIALFEETSRALAHMPSVLFWPLFPFAIQLATVAWAVAAAVCLATLGRAQFVSSSNSSDYSGILPLPDSLTSCNYGDALTSAARATESAASGAASAVGQSYPTNSSNAATNEAISYVNASLAEACRFLKYGGAEYAVFFQIFNVFMFFWNFNFIAGFGITTLASSFASYYWAFDKSSDIPKFPLLTGLWRTFRYHLGSIAFGSLLIAIVQLIRVLLDYLFMKMKKQRNHVAAFLVKCLECCFSCIEKLVKFIARKAYIMVAVHGKNFCASALEAWQLITRNALRAVVLTGVSRFLIIVSKLIVTGSIIVLAYFYFHGELPAAWSTLGPTWPILNYFYVPVVIISIATFVIASMCFHVYEVGVETMFLSFLEDCERNDGSAEKPYFMSKSLASHLR